MPEKTMIKLGSITDPYWRTEHNVAAVYGGDIRYDTIGNADASDAQWHLCKYGAFDRHMVGCYWFVVSEIVARADYPGLWEKYQAAISAA